MSIVSLYVHYLFGKSDRKKNKGLTTPDNIVRYDDIQYGPDSKWNVLDVYRPKDAESKTLPVIVSVHGGAWVYGDKDLYQYYCMSLCQHGFAVVNFTYRLAPKYKYPSPLEDTNLVMQWIMTNANDYNLDINNIFAVGDSAGANDLGLYAAICTNLGYRNNYSFDPPENFVLRGIALNCGDYEITKELIDKDNNNRLIMQEYLGKPVTAEKLEQINVLSHITEAFPPTYLMSSNRDFLQNQYPLMDKILEEKNIRHISKFYGDESTLLSHVFHLDMRSQAAHQCNKDECDFFRSLMV